MHRLSPIRRRSSIRLAPLAALMLFACATPTPYQPLGTRGTGASGCYASQQIEQNRFRVSFSGNQLTSRERVENYLLFRAAELTVQNGYRSEEHTSELQSLMRISYAAFCFKKKKQNKLR